MQYLVRELLDELNAPSETRDLILRLLEEVGDAALGTSDPLDDAETLDDLAELLDAAIDLSGALGAYGALAEVADEGVFRAILDGLADALRWVGDLFKADPEKKAERAARRAARKDARHDRKAQRKADRAARRAARRT